MRNLDNQMMLYFSDKSLIFKLYYYILLKRKKKEQGKNVETSYYTREIHTPSLNHKQSDSYHTQMRLNEKPFGREKQPHSHTQAPTHPQRSYTLKTNQVNGYQLYYILLATSRRKEKKNSRRKGKPPK